MIKFTMTNVINSNADTFWKVFFDKTFNERVYREVLGFPDFQIINQQETATQILRKVSVRPKLNVPDQVNKLLGDTFGYTDDGAFDKATKVFTWKGIPNVMGDKMGAQGTLRVEPIDASHVRRIVDLTVEVRLFGIGDLVEGLAKQHLSDGWERSATFHNTFLASNPI